MKKFLPFPVAEDTTIATIATIKTSDGRDDFDDGTDDISLILFLALSRSLDSRDSRCITAYFHSFAVNYFVDGFFKFFLLCGFWLGFF